MAIWAIDCETALMQEGLAAPPLICAAVSDGERDQILVPWEGESPHARFEQILRSGDLLINQHIFFDLGVLCAERPDLVLLVFEALEAGRIRCVKVREQLIRIALGQAKFIEQDDTGESDEDEEGSGVQKTRFDLAAICERWLGVKLEKEDTWRKSYALLRDIPLSRWPSKARDYVCLDSHYALAVWQKQQEWIDANFDDNQLPGEIEANCAAWALHLMKIWGVRTCPEAVAKLRYDLEMQTLWFKIGLMMRDERDPAYEPLLRKGGTGVKPKAVETKSIVQARVAAAFKKLGQNPPFTPPSKNFPDGQISTKKKVLDDSQDPVLKTFGEFKYLNKILTTYIPRYVEKGTVVPITADWNPLVESFRISCSKPNLTNPPRAGEVRNCFKARDELGMVYVSADFDQAELRSWSQVEIAMFGDSIMSEFFKAGLDPHLKLAAELLGITYEEAERRLAEGDKQVEDMRQFCKEPNFGLIGGMGWRKFKERAALKGIELSDEYSEEVRLTWMKTWNAKRYLDYFSDNYSEPDLIVHPITGMLRGGCGYSDGANHCVDYNTEALTKRGWVFGGELTLEDELLTKNQETGKLEWQKPTALNHYPHVNGDLYEFDHKAISAVTTSNHRWLIRDRRYGDKCVTTQDFVKRANGWWSIHRTGELGKSDDDELTDDVLELIGWFLTDGNIEKPLRNSIRITFYQTKKENVRRIDALLSRLGLAHRRDERAFGSIVWRFSANPRNGNGLGLARFLRDTFPQRLLTQEFIVRLSRRQARHLVDVMMLGDGTTKGQKTFYTKTEKGADVFQFLLTVAGIASKSEAVDRRGEEGNFSEKMPNIPTPGLTWKVRLYGRDKSQITKKQIRRVQGDGRGVWCPSVPNGFFVARRNKKVYVTGNSFQHLTAIGAKQALWDLSKECYTDRKSILYGARPIILMHDEIFGEIREEVAAEGAIRWGEVMKAGMAKWVRDVPTKCTPVLTRRLYKGAKPVKIDGKLVPSKPAIVDGKKKWIADLFEEKIKMRRAA
jgi:hypothetical protein